MPAAMPLRMGPLGAPGFEVRRSGVRWLCADGHLCRPNEVVAFCNLELKPQARRGAGTAPFSDELRDLQVAFAPRLAGRLRISPAITRGGFIDQLPTYHGWSPSQVIGHLETSAEAEASHAGDPAELRLLLGCGRRTTELAEVRQGFLTGWHNRSRAWWSDTEERFGTLLSVGICEQGGIVRGEKFGFFELFEATRGPAQAVFVPDNVLVPSAAILCEQLERSAVQSQAIVRDMTVALAGGAATASPADWLFTGALLDALATSPLLERYDLLSRHGLQREAGPDALLLSLHAETGTMLRHRQLGYLLNFHRWRLRDCGTVMRSWLQSQFELVQRTPEEIRRDYETLIDRIRARSAMKVLILNVMSSNGLEEIRSYAPFDRPMRSTLATIRSKELNLMLHDLARVRDISIVDADAIAAEIGAQHHLPDGVHASGLMQAQTRDEILRILRASGVPGFSPSALR